jgi:hypothetical protein
MKDFFWAANLLYFSKIFGNIKTGKTGNLNDKPRKTENWVRVVFQSVLKMSSEKTKSVLLQACHIIERNLSSQLKILF